MKTVLKVMLVLLGLPTAAIALFFVWASAGTTAEQTYADVVDYGTEAAAPKDSYTIVSYNIGYLSGLANNTTTRPEQSFFDANKQQAISALASVTPDIVGFQEIDIAARRSYDINQVEAIAQALGMSAGAIAINWDKNYLPFPYWPPAAHFGKILSGQAILSRYPIENNRRVVLERVAKPFFYNAFYLDRLAQVSEIRLGDRAIIVISVHLEAFEESTRVNQTQFVRQLAEDYAKTYPVIVMGDFNSAINRPTFVTATGETYGEQQFSIKEMLASEQLAPVLPVAEWPTEVVAEGGNNTATFPSDEPAYKLDYLFYTPSTIEVVETQVMTSAAQASDHLPLMMRFRLK
ncbi:MAG: endonuclease/exonuclease/phosphatase family protein [Cyanobacteria bacterium P01_A01_bin.116]